VVLLSVIDSSCSSAVRKRRTPFETLVDGQKRDRALLLLLLVVVGTGDHGFTTRDFR
jgi:hypothetical protein